MKANCRNPLYWHRCYADGFDLIAPESYAHPAKMSPALCYRILQHLEELGLLKQGDTILDPMAGTGITNICAGAMGYPSVGVELEEKFVNFQHQNKDYAERKLYKPLDWTILQGDSRNLSELLQGNGLKSVMSPPYGHDSTTHKGEGNTKARTPAVMASGHGKETYYSDNEFNIGNGKSESYLQAMQTVYTEIAKVSDVLVVVVKNPTHNKQLRRLDLDTIRIMEASGWNIHCQHRALLFEELEQVDIFSGTHKKAKGRMSFFKRLSWQNNQPVASWEDIIVGVK